MERYKKCLEHIEKYWRRLTVSFPKDKKIHIGLPNKFIAPTPKEGKFGNDMFYWDNYFIILGLVESGRVSLAKGIVDNFVYLYKRFGIMPLRNRFYNLGISQPPFFTSMILEVFNVTKDKRWLRNVTKIAEKEYEECWLDGRKRKNKRCIYYSLSRYCDHFITHSTAENESGWDMTSRFNRHCLNYLPVDLNSCLYKYEMDFVKIYRILGDEKKEKFYQTQANKRKRNIMRFMWNEEKGFFFDYDYRNKKQSSFYSVAGFFPLWAGLVSDSQAKRVRDRLRRFEYKGGLATTQRRGLLGKIRQWDYPNGWANLNWIVIKGLLNYSFRRDAKRIATKWLEMNRNVFVKTRKLWEKYDVVNVCKSKKSRYPNQPGFGWTNAVFLKLVNEFF